MAGIGIGRQGSSDDGAEIVWNASEPWHFYVLLAVALLLTICWAVVALRGEAERRTVYCTWCGHMGCRCKRSSRKRRGPR